MESVRGTAAVSTHGPCLGTAERIEGFKLMYKETSTV